MSQSRPNWASIIRLDSLSVPVSAYTTLDSKRSRVSLLQLHDGCHARVRSKPHCPVHGELKGKEVVKHYAFGPNQYVAITPKEIVQLQPDANQGINVLRFVARGTIDPIKFAGTHYYLLPSNPQARQPYAILHQAMLDERVSGIAQVVISQHDRLVMLRAMKRLLVVSVLRYAEAVRPVTAFDPNLGNTPISARDLSAVKSLIAEKRDDRPHLDEFHDPNLERLTELIAAKMAEGSVVA
jgi:DNA end-binding protein Ku